MVSSEKEIKYIKEIIFLKKEILLYYLEWIHDIGIETSNLDHREMASGIVLTAIIDVLPSGGRESTYSVHTPSLGGKYRKNIGENVEISPNIPPVDPLYYRILILMANPSQGSRMPK